MTSSDGAYIFQQVLQCNPGEAPTVGIFVDYEEADESALLRYLKTGTRTQREKAFAELYRRYYDHVRWFIRSKIASEEDAKDIFSEVWVTAIEKLPDFVWTGKSIKPWLFTTAHNKVQERIRENGHFASFSEDLPEQTFPFIQARLEVDDPSSVAPVSTPVKSEANKVVHKLLSCLKKREQKVIRLKYFNGKTNQEIADHLHITPENARVIAHRAIKKMRQTK